MKKITFVALLIGLVQLAYTQETVGLVFDDVNLEKSNGYTLFNALSDDRVFLINNCGEAVKQWDFSGQISTNFYILENGNILQSNRFNADIRDWNNNILWSIDFFNDLGFSIHHDIEPLPNGNFLVLVRDTYTNAEMIAQGKDTSFQEAIFALDKIVEIQPVGTNSANIVWEWKFFDHMVQEFDSSKPNFGSVANNPQLLHMDYDNNNPVDYTHTNSVDYNEDLDQIIISARHTHEIYIIDHSTTTAEAASHSGGIYGMGGDFLWRWGNPEVYDKGTINDRKLGSQHDAKWIPDGPYEGKISAFSNDGYGTDLTASSIHIIDQNDTNGVYSLSAGEFLPNDYFWSYDGTIMGEVMQGSSRCGMQIMSNGNALINETDKGRISEVDGSGNVVWVYIIPIADGSNINQFEDPDGNSAFRAHRYPENYVGFTGLSFNNTGIIENVNSISENCSNLLSVEDTFFNDLSVYPNPTNGILHFDFSKPLDQIEVYSITGKMVLGKTNSDFINLESLAKGMYMVKISTDSNSEFIKVLKN